LDVAQARRNHQGATVFTSAFCLVYVLGPRAVFYCFLKICAEAVRS